MAPPEVVHKVHKAIFVHLHCAKRKSLQLAVAGLLPHLRQAQIQSVQAAEQLRDVGRNDAGGRPMVGLTE